MMKSLRQIFFGLVMVVGLALTASAQKDQPKPRPPKGDPPVIKPGDKPRPPKGDDKPKKPGFDFALIARSDEIV